MKDIGISRELFHLGLSPRHKGFHYLSSVLGCLLSGMEFDDAMAAARRETHDEHHQFERCMRYAINYAWDVSDCGIRRLFPGYKMPPTPTEFMFALEWELLEKREAAGRR